MTKEEIRKHYLDKRLGYSDGYIEEASVAICRHFFKRFELTNVRCIHLFLSIAEKKELNTQPILDSLLTTFPTLPIALSKSNFQTNELYLYQYDPMIPMLKNRYGIPEPQGGSKISPQSLDIALVPLLITDLHGHRIGYGKGFYDRFLAECRPGCLKIGLSLEEPIDKLPAEPFDFPLTHCISPTRIYDFFPK